MGSIVLPPAPNWFHPNTISCNENEKLYASASFKNIVIYSIIHNKETRIQPEKTIAFNYGKVKGLSIYPYKNKMYRRMLAAFGDIGGLLLINCDTGSYIAEQKVKEVFNSLCWVVIDGEDCISAVGNSGLISIWTPKDMSLKSHHMYDKKNLTVIEPIPFNRSEALIVCQNQIIQVNLKNCEALKYFKGHQQDIYCINWCDGVKNPFEVDLDYSRSTEASDDSIISDSYIDVDRADERAKFFASSDFSKNILIWDFELGRYKVVLEQAGKPRPREKQKNIFHISLLWVDCRLYSSTITGEVLAWNLRDKEVSYRPLYYIHNRVIYNMTKIGHTIVTYAQDRQICGFDLNFKKPVFEIPTIGMCPRTMSFNPHDSSRLAMGFQDGNIKVINFQKENNVKTQFAAPNVKNVILSLSWHPVEETQLLYGTSDGQVGIIDLQSKKSKYFSHFHKYDVYRVEWAPPMNPKKYGLADNWCIYSLGGSNLYMRSPIDLVKDPVDLIKTLPNIGPNPKPTDFSFSPDYELLAIGYNEGHISIYDFKTETLRIKIESVRKIIQHLIWKPFTSSQPNYILGVASGEIIVYLFDLTHNLKTASPPNQEPVLVLQATREFLGHRSRVAWLSWSSHNDELLASASYDHTVQVWNAKTGEPICCYGGHPNRLFRVEFSPTEPNILFSFSEENCLHKWCTKDVKTILTKDAITANKERARSNFLGETEEIDAKTGDESEESQPQQRKGKPTVVSKCSSYFPAFHTANKRKRSFHHLCLLILREELQIKKEFVATENSEEAEDHTKIFPHIDRKQILKDVLAKYGEIMPNEVGVTVTDVSTYLDFFGDVSEAFETLNRELNYHLSKGNSSHCDEMHLWNGTLENHIKWCAKNHTLSPFLVSMAPSVSGSLWEHACLAYSEQLVAQGEVIIASSYLLCLQKDIKAVRLLASRHHYREALCIARTKLSFDHEINQEVVESWATASIREGNFELAAVLYLSIGKYDNAARTMSRRTELWSLMLGREIYELGNNEEMSEAMGAMAFKEAVRRNNLAVFNTFLNSCPGLRWLKPLYISVTYLIDEMNEIETPSVENFNIPKKKGEPFLLLLERVWAENEISRDSSYVKKYLKYFPLDLIHVSVQDKKQMMLLWLSTAVAMAMAIITGDGRKPELWETAINFIFEAACSTSSSSIIYKLLSVIFRSNTEVVSIEDMLRCLLYEYKFEEGTLFVEKEIQPLVKYLKTWRCIFTLCGLNCLHSSILYSKSDYKKDDLKNYIEMQCDIYEIYKRTMGNIGKSGTTENKSFTSESSESIPFLATEKSESSKSSIVETPGSNKSPVTENPGSNKSPVTETPRSNKSPVTETPGSNKSPFTGNPGSNKSPVIENTGSNKSPVLETTGSNKTSTIEKSDSNNLSSTENSDSSNSSVLETPESNKSPVAGNSEAAAVTIDNVITAITGYSGYVTDSSSNEYITGVNEKWKKHHFNEDWNKLDEAGVEILASLYGIIDSLSQHSPI